MAKVPIPFQAGDISTVARSLSHQLGNCDHAPSHVELLNMLARSTGNRNYQALRAQLVAQKQLDALPPEPEPVDYVQVRRIARYFDAQGRLVSWPAKTVVQTTCLWVVWSKLEAGRSYTEDELNRQIRACHLFGDHALLRRGLCDDGLVKRTVDGKQYRRVEQQPSAEGLALIRHLAARVAPASSRGRAK